MNESKTAGIVLKGRPLCNINYALCEPAILMNPETRHVYVYYFKELPVREQDIKHACSGLMFVPFLVGMEPIVGDGYIGTRYTAEDFFDGSASYVTVSATVDQIEWDTDDETVELPPEVDIRCECSLSDDGTDFEYDDIVDAVSDRYGWCIRSACTNVHTEPPGTTAQVAVDLPPWAIRYMTLEDGSWHDSTAHDPERHDNQAKAFDGALVLSPDLLPDRGEEPDMDRINHMVSSAAHALSRFEKRYVMTYLRFDEYGHLVTHLEVPQVMTESEIPDDYEALLKMRLSCEARLDGPQFKYAMETAEDNVHLTNPIVVNTY